MNRFRKTLVIGLLVFTSFLPLASQACMSGYSYRYYHGGDETNWHNDRSDRHWGRGDGRHWGESPDGRGGGHGEGHPWGVSHDGDHG